MEHARKTFPAPQRTLGVVVERREDETRVTVVPRLVSKVREMGFAVLMENGAGIQSGFPDQEFKDAGVRTVPSNREVFAQADVVLKVGEPDAEELEMLQKDQTLVTFFNMSQSEHILSAVQKAQATCINMNLVPRISRAQKMDALSSMANIAAYRAVLDGFQHLPRISRACSTSSGALPPAKVLVLGAGVAGLSAIATACALGAEVFASDVRSAAKEQVEAMGATFVDIETPVKGNGAGGYAAETTEVFRALQLATYARLIKDMDIVVTTALIPNKPAPLLVTAEMVRSMHPGSVIVDMAAEAGGNCELTIKNDITQDACGVTLIGKTNYPAEMPGQASFFLAQTSSRCSSSSAAGPTSRSTSPTRWCSR